MDAKNAFVHALFSQGVIVVTPEPIRLKSGRETRIYVNFRDFALWPDNLAMLTGLFGSWLARQTGGRPALGAAASLLSPYLAGAMAAVHGLPCLMHRPGTQERGLAETVFAYDKNPAAGGARFPVVLIDDVASTGATLDAAAKAFAARGFATQAAFVFVDKRRRGEPGLGPSVHAPLTLAEALRLGLDDALVAPEARPAVARELDYLLS